MFEHEQHIVDTLLSEDSNFKRLYHKHAELNEKVDAANSKSTTVDDYHLEDMKKRKLLLKDQMAAIISQYKQTTLN